MKSETDDGDEPVKSSDQLPQEGPAGQVPDDVPEAQEAAAREAARRHAQHASRGRPPGDRGGEET
jgi:hypothetical protein